MRGNARRLKASVRAAKMAPSKMTTLLARTSLLHLFAGLDAAGESEQVEQDDAES